MGCWLAEMVKFVETVSLSGNQRAESTSAHAMAWGRTDRDDITAARTRAPWTPPAPAGRLRAGAAELTHDGHARRTPPQPLTADLLDRAGRKRNGLGLGTGPPSPSASVSPRRYRASRRMAGAATAYSMRRRPGPSLALAGPTTRHLFCLFCSVLFTTEVKSLHVNGNAT